MKAELVDPVWGAIFDFLPVREREGRREKRRRKRKEKKREKEETFIHCCQLFN